MSSIIDQIKPDTAERIAAEARARGVSVDEYLKSLIQRPNGIDLNARGIDKSQAAELRARLKSFAEDWDRPEADIYDENPPR
ncbi:MAG: hypothetical protein AABM67_12895 [Acidobacteriota bacterium]